MSDISVIAPNHRVVGTISAAEDLVVQGRVEGRILSEATLVIDASAIIEGDVLARHVVVRGVIVGDVSGVEAIEVAPSGQILGDLRTRRLSLKAGGRIAGVVHTGIEVPGHNAANKSAASWQRPTRAATSAVASAPPAARSWSEEVVETGPRPATAANVGAADLKKAKKEPSREAL